MWKGGGLTSRDRLNSSENYLLLGFLLAIQSQSVLLLVRHRQGSRKPKIGWELNKNGCHVQSPGLSKKPYMVSCKTYCPYYRGLYAFLLGLLDQFGWQSPFPVAHFGWWKLISEAISAG